MRIRFISTTRIPDPFYETNPGSKISAKIMEISRKINQNNKNIIYFSSKILNFCITDLNISFINNETNNFWRNIFLIEKKKCL